MTLTTESLKSSRPTTTRGPDPAVQRLLDERRDLMAHEVTYGLGKSGHSRLALIEEELAALEEKAVEVENDIRIDLAALTDAYGHAFEAAYQAEIARCDAREALIEITTKLQAARRRAHNAGIPTREFDSFTTRVTGPGGDPVAWDARRLQSRIAKLVRVPW